MEKRKICVYCEKWESGGIESFLHSMLTRMDLSGLEVDLVAACLQESVFTADLEGRGVRFRELSGSQRNLTENHRQFRELLAEREYDVVYVNAFQALSLVYLRMAEAAGVPVRIAHSHNTDLRKSATRWLKLRLHDWARGRYTGCATHLWACSRAAAEFLFDRDILAEKGFHFIPNGIGTERFAFRSEERAALRAELGLTEAFVIGHVGRLCYQKNQMFLLEVLAEARKRDRSCRLLLVGEGEDEQPLRKRAAELGVTEAVTFYGVSSQVERLMWAMDVFAFPSRFEGLGIVAVEAQAAGLPVLCSEFVPGEARVTEFAGEKPLADGAAAWAEALLESRGPEDRSGAWRAVRAAGFDADDGAKALERVWRQSR